MSDGRAHPVGRLEATRVRAAPATEHQEHGAGKRAAREPGMRVPVAATAAATSARATDLSFQIDDASQRVTVQVIDRETKSVLRSFPLRMPGNAAPAADAPGERGAIVDATA